MFTRLASLFLSLFLIVSTSAQLPYYGTNMGGTIGCVVTGTKLFSHGNYIRDLNPDEMSELTKYKKELVIFKEKVDAAYANMEAIAAKNGTMPLLPNRPMMPAFCASSETTLYILGGCTVQNHKIYIAGKWARDLNEKEKHQLDEFAKKMAATNYASAMAAAAIGAGVGGLPTAQNTTSGPSTTTISPLTEAGRQIALDFCTEF